MINMHFRSVNFKADKKLKEVGDKLRSEFEIIKKLNKYITPIEILNQRKKFRTTVLVRNIYSEVLNILQAVVMKKLYNQKLKSDDKKNLNDEKYTLIAYENLDYLDVEGYENYLFLPFLDQTNGYETYGGGRYIDLYQYDNDSILIDFNRAYNPQCVYDENFSCPIVPRNNLLNIRVEAGVKNFVSSY